MGFLRAKGVIYKAVEEVDLSHASKEFYLRANVKGCSFFLVFFVLKF